MFATFGNILELFRIIESPCSHGQRPGISQTHDQHKQISVLRRPDTRALPLPTITFEVTETGFLPVALSVEPAISIRCVGHQTPGFLISLLPDEMNISLDTPTFLENDTFARPRLSGLNETLKGLPFSLARANFAVVLYTKEIVPAHRGHTLHQLRRRFQYPGRPAESPRVLQGRLPSPN